MTKLYVTDGSDETKTSEEVAQLHEQLDRISRQLERIEDLVQDSQLST